MRVAIVRTGGPWQGKAKSTLTSQGNHDAIARAVMRAGHEVLCVGRMDDEFVMEGADCLGWTIRPEQNNGAEITSLLDEFKAWRPDVLINVCGPGTTNVTPNNQRGNTVQSSTWRYYWPLYEILRETRMPRICVITDCRCYPREQEIAFDEWNRPAAMLSQENLHWSQRILDSTISATAVYAGIETLRMDVCPITEPQENVERCCIVGHAHMSDQRIARNKDVIWLRMTRVSFTIPTYGDGWHAFHADRSSIKPMGVTTHPQETFARYASCLLMPMRSGWISPKLGEAARAGCAPLLITTPELSYDGDGILVPLNSDLRVKNSEDVERMTERFHQDFEWRRFAVEQITRVTRPNPGKLLECIEHFGRAGAVDKERFGGYDVE